VSVAVGAGLPAAALAKGRNARLGGAGRGLSALHGHRPRHLQADRLGPGAAHWGL